MSKCLEYNDSDNTLYCVFYKGISVMNTFTNITLFCLLYESQKDTTYCCRHHITYVTVAFK